MGEREETQEAQVSKVVTEEMQWAELAQKLAQINLPAEEVMPSEEQAEVEPMLVPGMGEMRKLELEEIQQELAMLALEALRLLEQEELPMDLALLEMVE